MLLVHANQVVSSDRLIEELWPGQPADRAADSLQVRLWQLRKAFRSVGEAGRLATQPPGYLLRVAAEELDALRFERLAAEGNAALGSGDAATAARRLDEALREWRGPTWTPCRSPVRRRAGWRRSGWPRSNRGPKRYWPAAGTGS
jgi:DNA-binding SARP family transcriptional activator